MGKRSKRSQATRYPNPIANPPILYPRLSLMRPLMPLTQVEDRRTYHPLGPARPARSLSGSPHRLIVPKARTYARISSRVPHMIGFANPSKILICVRRKIRREVILAKGKGGGRHRRPRFSHYSSIKC